MRILVSHNGGSGYAGYAEYPDGTTFDTVVRDKLEGDDPSNYTLRLNSGIATPDRVLVEQDQVSITPKHVAGAAGA